MDLLAYELLGFEIALGSYLVCSLLFIGYFATKKENSASTAFVLAALGFAFQTFALGVRWFYAGHPPWVNTYEVMSFFSWAIIGTYLILSLNTSYRSTGLIACPIAFILMSFASLQPKNPQPLVPALQSGWLLIHVPITIAAYCGFVISFIASLLYLFKEKEIHSMADSSDQGGKKLLTDLTNSTGISTKTSQLLSRFRLEDLEDLSYKGVAIGFPLLTIGIITGAIWADRAWGSYWSWDPKETWALITWGVFLIYLHARTSNWNPKTSAYISVFGFLSVLFTFLGVGYVLPFLERYLVLSSGLHSYAGGDDTLGTILFVALFASILLLLVLTRIKPPGPKRPLPSKFVVDT